MISPAGSVLEWELLYVSVGLRVVSGTLFHKLMHDALWFPPVFLLPSHNPSLSENGKALRSRRKEAAHSQTCLSSLFLWACPASALSHLLGPFGVRGSQLPSSFPYPELVLTFTLFELGACGAFYLYCCLILGTHWSSDREIQQKQVLNDELLSKNIYFTSHNNFCRRVWGILLVTVLDMEMGVGKSSGLQRSHSKSVVESITASKLAEELPKPRQVSIWEKWSMSLKSQCGKLFLLSFLTAAKRQRM